MEQMAKFYEIFDYYYKPFTQTIYFKLAIAGGILLLIGIVALIIWFKKFKKPQPWEWAEEELNKIDMNSYKTKKEFKDFYFTITGIIKHYLEKRHSWDTQGKTDEELVTYLKARNFAVGPLASLEKIAFHNKIELLGYPLDYRIYYYHVFQ